MVRCLNMGIVSKIRTISLVYFLILGVMAGMYVNQLLVEQKRNVEAALFAVAGLPIGRALYLDQNYNLALIALVVLMPGVYVAMLSVGRAVWMIGVSTLGIVVTGMGIRSYFGFELPMFYMLLGIAVGTVVALGFKLVYSSREQEFLRLAFSQFVSESVLRELLKDPNKLSLQGKELQITVMFLDIRGFTSFSEKKNPVVVVNRLNNLLDIASKIIFKHGGTIDKYIGDAIMAFWGAPTLDKKQATNAIMAAREIRDKLQSETEFQVGVGLNYGTAIVGNIGSSKRFDYTAIGDTVNTAARLEAATKELSESIVLSGAVVEKLVEEKAGLSGLKDRGTMLVKGKKEPIHVFAI